MQSGVIESIDDWDKPILIILKKRKRSISETRLQGHKHK